VRDDEEKRPSLPPGMADAHLTALLMFLSGAAPNDKGQRTAAQFDAADGAARAMLTSHPLPNAFGAMRDRPIVYGEVAAALQSDLYAWTEPKETWRAFNAIESARNETGDADTLLASDVRDLLPAYIDTAVLVGACLMYRLLNGGSR
jgi:hypothetical protein